MAWEIETVFTLDDASLFAEIDAIADWGQFLWEEVDAQDPGYAQYQTNLAGFTVPGGADSFDDLQFSGAVSPVPTWDDCKALFFNYAWAAHEAEFAATDVGRSLVSLLGNTVEYGKVDKRWTDVEIRTGESKPTWKQVSDQWAILESSDSVLATVAGLYETMSDNMNAQILATFATSDKHAASAFAQSWRLKVDNPSEYSGIGLTALEPIAGFSFNDPLDTDIKIVDYFTAKVAQVIAFDKFRDAEILTYLAAKAAAEA